MVLAKRFKIEMSLALLVVVLTLIFLNYHGIASRTVGNIPRTIVVEKLHDSLNLWKAQKTHGKILILFDRYLPLDVLTYQNYELKPEDISLSDARTLLAKIDAMFGLPSMYRTGNAIDDINRILRDPHFASIWQAKSNIMPPQQALRLLRITRGYNILFDSLMYNEQRNIVLLNRLLLQASFPEYIHMIRTPAHEMTYVRSAIRAGIVRKIIHVLSDRSWEEVCNNLEELPTVKPSGTGFHFVTFGGTPVYITRLKDVAQLSEKVLVNIDSNYWTPNERTYIDELLRNGTISADYLLISNNEPQDAEKQ